jgi:hypothetical protein
MNREKDQVRSTVILGRKIKDHHRTRLPVLLETNLQNCKLTSTSLGGHKPRNQLNWRLDACRNLLGRVGK